MSILSGMFAGFAYSSIVPLVLIAIQSESDLATDSEPFYLGSFEITTPKIALVFLIVCLIVLICRTASIVLLERVGFDAAKKLRIFLYGRISKMPTKNLEDIGPSRLMSLLFADVPQLIAGAGVFPMIMINVFTCIGLLGFLFYLNMELLIIVIGVMLFGVFTYRIPISYASRFSRKSREVVDKIQEGVRGLIYGAKELKLNNGKRISYCDEELYRHEEERANLRKKSSILMVGGRTYGDILTFLLVGLIAFVILNFYELTAETVVSIVMVILYLSAPIGNLLNSIPAVIQGNVSYKKVLKLLSEMSEENVEEASEAIEFDSVSLKSVSFEYNDSGDHERKFKVGPIDLNLKAGEIVFLVGGNGSGKTTLGKILSLHYPDVEGQIHFGATKVTPSTLDACRQNISATFSDYFLFTKLFGFDPEVVHSIANDYIRAFSLDGKVSVKDGYFSTTKLSSGQRKRLALLVAIIEERKLYIFDEWAADQDPEFKDIFYNKILPSLRDAGKIVVAITHDSYYFHVADRVINLQEGRILNEGRVSMLNS